MYTIIMSRDKQLVTTVQTTIYQKDNLVDKIQFLFPPKYGELNLEECTVQFQYTDNANTIHYVTLEKDEELYKEKLRYHFSVCSDLTKFAGTVIGHIKFTLTDEESGETKVLHTGDMAITILPTDDYTDYDSDNDSSELSDLEQKVVSLEEKVDNLYELIEESMGIKRVSNLDEILEAISNDDIKTIILEDDIDCNYPGGIYIDNGLTKTINLNGHNINALCGDEDSNGAAFYVLNGTLTIEGDGFVDGGGGCPNDVAVWAYSENSKVTINGGNYTVHKDKDGAINSTIYAESGAEIIINGGHFDNDVNNEIVGAKRYVLNIQNNSGSTITCYGGEYVNQNPADGDDKDTATGYTFLGDGCAVTEIEEDEYTLYVVYKNEDN